MLATFGFSPSDQFSSATAVVDVAVKYLTDTGGRLNRSKSTLSVINVKQHAHLH